MAGSSQPWEDSGQGVSGGQNTLAVRLGGAGAGGKGNRRDAVGRKGVLVGHSEEFRFVPTGDPLTVLGRGLMGSALSFPTVSPSAWPSDHLLGPPHESHSLWFPCFCLHDSL